MRVVALHERDETAEDRSAYLCTFEEDPLDLVLGFEWAVVRARTPQFFSQ